MPSNNVLQYTKIRTRNEVGRKALKPEKKWNPALFGIRNPLCWNPESSTQNPESTAWNPESKTVLDSLTWSETNAGVKGCAEACAERFSALKDQH